MAFFVYCSIRIAAIAAMLLNELMLDVVCGLIENPHGEVLACKRGQGTHLAGLWEFPGGKIEEGESATDALKRELAEELELQIEVCDALQFVEWDYGNVAIRLHPYRCRIVAGEPRPHVHEEVRWCKPTEVGDLEWAPADRPILREWLDG